jgi:hypothetical protein
VTSLRAELSSISSTLAELTRRVTELAEQVRGPDAAGNGNGNGVPADLVAELFAVERSLKGALRRLERAATVWRS